MKNHILFIMISLLISVVSMSVIAMEPPTTINPASIAYNGQTKHGGDKYKWDAVDGVRGYQVEVIDRDLYDYDSIIQIYKRKTVSNNRVAIGYKDVPEGTHFKIMVRPFKSDENGNRIYGEWSVSLISGRRSVMPKYIP